MIAGLVLKGLYSGSKRGILPRGYVKHPAKGSESGAVTGRRRGRRAVQYVLILVGGVLIVDALVGDKGLVQTLKKRDEYRALE